jgi:hypothetical protein
MSVKQPPNTINTVPAPSVPGFETLFGLIPMRPIDSTKDKATEALEALLERKKEDAEKANRSNSP